MNVFDIIGPIMIGPSSSHTAGAARIGKVAHTIFHEKPVFAEILYHGSFAKTHKGHGTDQAIVAGILGMEPSDSRLKDSLDIAKNEGIELCFLEGEIENAHPNTARITLKDGCGKQIVIQGASVGGGNIVIQKINDMEMEFTGQNTTLVVVHQDVPGVIAEVTNVMARYGMNICNFKLRRNYKGGTAVMIIEIDGEADKGLNQELNALPHIIESTMLAAG